MVSDKENALLNIMRHFGKLSFPSIRYLHHYLSSDLLHELPPYNLVHHLEVQFPELIKAVPRIKGNELEAVIYNENTILLPNRWGVEEPVEGEIIHPELIDVILVPLLAFDENGNRVGYGKGYYDRFLAHCNPKALKIGLSYFEPLKEISDTDDFDISLNLCITPERIYEFG